MVRPRARGQPIGQVARCRLLGRHHLDAHDALTLRLRQQAADGRAAGPQLGGDLGLRGVFGVVHLCRRVEHRWREMPSVDV